jgi:Endonuclease-reverse transcriptase
MIQVKTTFRQSTNPAQTMNREMNGVTKLRVLQLNLNKSVSAHLKLINDSLAAHWDVVLIQKPYITYFSSIRTPNHFTSVTPTLWLTLDAPIQSTIWVNSALSTNNRKILDIHNMNDIVAIELNGTYGNLNFFSIYNAGENLNTLTVLRRSKHENWARPQGQQKHHILWGGDFNCHHLMWDGDEDTCLFTAKALEDAGELIELVAEQDMVMLLPKGIPTLKHMVMKWHSRPDNVFCTSALVQYVAKCDIMLERQLGRTDHYLIVTMIEPVQERTSEQDKKGSKPNPHCII